VADGVRNLLLPDRFCLTAFAVTHFLEPRLLSISGLSPSVLDTFGSLVTYTDATNLPPGVSPACQDVQFTLGGVRTRDGLVSVLGPLPGGVTINGLKTHITPAEDLRTLVLDSNGNLYREFTPGSLQLHTPGLAGNAFLDSTTLFGREYLALSNQSAGADMPRQYDDSLHLDRVSQCGPAEPPTAADEITVPVAIAASPNGAVQGIAATIAASPAGATQSGIVCTIATTAAHGCTAGQPVVIAGVGVAGYNGAWTVLTVIDSTHFTFAGTVTGLAASGNGTATPLTETVTIQTATAHGFAAGQTVAISGVGIAAYNGSWPITSVPDATHFQYAIPDQTALAASGGGTAQLAGNISPGVHQVTVLFQTRQGYITAPAPPGQWTAAGGRRAVITNIPVGPSNVVARILAFTGASGANLYYVPSTMVLADNVSTSLTVDFSDASLLAAQNIDQQFKLLELGECAGVTSYASRLFWWGERNKQSNWLNLTFDGGWDASGSGRPLGWQRDFTFGAGAQHEATDAVWGDSYRIVADGATATRGLITQSAVADYLAVPRLSANTGYSVRARVKRSSGLAQGTLHIHLFSASAAINTTGLVVSAASASTSWAEYMAELTPPLPAIPSDLLLRVYAGDTPSPSGESFLVDNIEIFPAADPVSGSVVRASRVESPESYDGVNGFLSIEEEDGQQVRAAFTLRGNLYFVKDRSLHSTADDGVNEPSLWAITPVSQRIGTPSVQGADVGDDFAVIAGRDGLYLFTGGEPQKLSTEIQPTWDGINWASGQTLWVRVDQQAKRILVGVPFGTATQPNAILVLDYRDGFDPPVRTSLSGRIVAPAQARRWTVWNIAANCCALAERADGTAKLFLGSNAALAPASGKIYQLTPGATDDDGAAIASSYATAFLSGSDLANTPPVGRQLFGYLQLNLSGAGNLQVTMQPIGAASPTPVALRPLPLANPSLHDTEITTRLYAERASYIFSPSQPAAPGHWFSLSKLVAWLRPAPFSFVRGGV